MGYASFFIYKNFIRNYKIQCFQSMLTIEQQAQTSVRKRRVMYVLILMVAVFMGSWMPLTLVNILRDFGIGFFETQM